MKRNIKYIVLLLLSTVVIFSCSTKKNTVVRRAYHNLTAHYNAYFNGRESFKEAMRQLDKNHVDDFSKVLPVFLYEDKQNLSSISGKMDRAIKKASKAIKRHSITKKPKRKKGKLTEKQKEFYSRKEFNNWVDDSYLLMGKAHLYKQENYEAIQNFQYILSQFPKEEIRFDALIWLTRVQIIEKHYDEAIVLLERIDGEEEFPNRLKKEYAKTYANYYIKQEKYKESVKWLKESIKLERKKKVKVRYKYILAQIYENFGDRKNASEMYRQVIKMNPQYEMAFNAKINQATMYDSESGNGKEMIKQLTKMLKDDKNKEYQDQIYYAIANIEFNDGDVDLAIEDYKKSAEVSVSNNTQKALSFLSLGNIYFKVPDYPNSQMYYDSCMSFLPNDYPNYEKLKTKTDILNELILNLNEVTLQDSLQRVAAMSEKDRLKLIDGIINKIKEEEAQAKIEEQQRMMEMALFNQNGGNSMNNQQNNSGKWYFYNVTTINMGKSEFKRKWGGRKLEDNWRRKNKSSINFETIDEEDQSQVDSAVVQKYDNKSREYYLQDIPLTDSAIAVSNEKIMLGLFNAGNVYKDRLSNFPKAIEQYEELDKRFPENTYLLDSWYFTYQSAKLSANDEKANEYKNKIITEYPDSKYAKSLTNPNYFAELEQANQKIYMLYDKTYKQYQRGNFMQVINNANYVDSMYKDNELLPKFMLLKAMSVGGTGNVDLLKQELNDLINKYPDAEESKTADYIITRITEENYTNFIPQTGTQYVVDNNTETSIVEDTSSVNPEDIINEELYKFNKDKPHYYVVAVKIKSADYKRVKFDLAKYNMENFLMFDFKIKSIPYSDDIQLIVVKEFTNKRQAKKYFKIITKRSDVFTKLKRTDYTQFLITKKNLETLRIDKDLDKYMLFYDKNY